jgi:hypothetical protein
MPRKKRERPSRRQQYDKRYKGIRKNRILFIREGLLCPAQDEKKHEVQLKEKTQETRVLIDSTLLTGVPNLR